MSLRDKVLMYLPNWAEAFSIVKDQVWGYEKLGLSKFGLRNQLEPGICLRLKDVLESQGSEVYLNVKGVAAPIFDTDIDVLEFRDGKAIAYEVKGLRVKRRGRGKEKVLSGPGALEGAEQALNHLLNAGFSVDYAYLVHPALMFRGYILRTAIILDRLTPLGYIVITPIGELVELVKPRPNPLKGTQKLADIPRNAILGVDPRHLEKMLEKEIERDTGIPIDFSIGEVVKIHDILKNFGEYIKKRVI
ncbi:hypothetical protein J4526_01405 [Desulfurococcaceae archaeon MEX13E-LK6-19]|nr:hypothetical protein J4526_01405 [Desulfurococcaceae archaeon MEX13E-LK6-19]